MKFNELMIDSRGRLHDLRTPSGSLITNAVTDGIRWSADQLEKICRRSVEELTRTLRSRKLVNYLNQGLQVQLPSGTITASSGYGIVNIPSFNDVLYTVIRIQEIGESEAIYTYADPEEFFSIRDRLATVGDDSEIVSTDRRFTYLYDPENNKVVVVVLPIPSEEKNIQLIVHAGLEAIYTKASTIDLPFVGIDDLILDYVEREASAVQHDVGQVKLITELIQLKLQELNVEI